MVSYSNIYGDGLGSGTLSYLANNWLSGSTSWTYLDDIDPRLPEAEAWREIGRRIEESGCEKGLCMLVNELYNEERIWFSTCEAMLRRIRSHLDTMPRRWWQRKPAKWLDEPGIAGPRILAAYLLAEEAESGC